MRGDCAASELTITSLLDARICDVASSAKAPQSTHPDITARTRLATRMTRTWRPKRPWRTDVAFAEFGISLTPSEYWPVEYQNPDQSRLERAKVPAITPKAKPAAMAMVLFSAIMLEAVEATIAEAALVVAIR